MYSVCLVSSILFVAPSFQKHLLNNVHNLYLARALLPGLDNFDSSLENQCSDRTESEPEGEGWGCGLSEVLKEKVVKRDRQERRGSKMLGEQKKKGEKHRRKEKRRGGLYNTRRLVLCY